MLTSTTVNGIPALWTEAPPPYTAALVVRAGAQDETVRTVGVGHLVEHLVMSRQPRTTLDVNASVDDVITVFHATGARDEVTEWLAGVCDAIHDLPLDRMPLEAKVLDAEDGDAVESAVAWSAGARFGARGAGLLGRQGPPHRALLPEHVVAFTHRLYTAANAVLVSTGEPPRHPGIRLPQGPEPERAPTEESDLTLPAYLSGPPIPIVSWLGRREASAPVLGGLVADRLTDALRHGEGIVYDVAIGSTPLTAEEGMSVLWADGSERDQPRILAEAVAVLRALAQDGPQEGELAHQKALARAQMGDPRAVVEHLVHGALRLLEGRPVLDVDEEIAQVQAVTAGGLRQAAGRALETLLLAGSEPAPDGVAGIPDRTDEEVPECPVFEGRSWKRRLVSRAPRDLRVVIGDEGLSQTVFRRRHGGRWADLEGVATGPDFRALIFRDGSQVVLWPESVADGGSLVAELDRRAGGLLFEVDEDWL
ncbi:MAG: hypothetical protein ACJ711_00045 [Ornithinibacter sp.]